MIPLMNQGACPFATALINDRRGDRVKMHRNSRMNMRYVLWVAVLLSPVPALAEIDFYVGAGVSATKIETSGILGALENVGLTASAEMDKTAFGGQIFAGTMFTKNVGLEIKYSDSGEADETIAVMDPGMSLTESINIEASMDGFTFYGVAAFPFPKLAEVAIKLGYTIQDMDVTVEQFGSATSASTDDDGLALAGVLRFRIGDHWAVAGEVEYFSIDFDDSFDEPLRFSINGEYRF